MVINSVRWVSGLGRKLKFKPRHRLAGAGLVGLDRDLAAPLWRRNKQAPIITSAQRTPASGGIMKRLSPFTFIALLLCGCPDAKLPKPTPMVPEPKASVSEVKTSHAHWMHVVTRRA